MGHKFNNILSNRDDKYSGPVQVDFELVPNRQRRHRYTARTYPPIYPNDISWLKHMLRQDDPTPPTTPPTDPPTTKDDGSKPVLMKDLWKALEDFEKKITGKEDDKTSTTTKDEALEKEATRQVYMKDLWKVLGLNHKGRQYSCEGSDEDDNASGDEVTRDKLQELLDKIKKGSHVKTGIGKPNDNNLEWYKVKIPK